MKNLIIFLLGGLAVLAGCATTLYYTHSVMPSVGDAGIGQIIDDPNGPIPTAGIFTPGPTADTVVAATNTARIYLEISNISTTSVGQVLYCNTNDRPATVGQGMAIFASSTRVLTNTHSAIRCRYPAASSSAAVLER